ncbi:hypothetical protein CR513_23646, partial [Mucuna pruriens]
MLPFLLVIEKVSLLLILFILGLDVCKSIRKIWSDNGNKYVNLEFSKFVIDQDELTCVNTPQQNGVVERKNHHLKVARALLYQMSVREKLSFFPSSPLLLNLPCRVFGYVAFVHSHSPNHAKLDPRAIKCIFIGYPSNKKRYKGYHPQSSWFFMSMDITFHETQSSFVSPQLQGESILEVEFVLGSLPLLSLQDVQDTNHENTHKDYKKAEKED